MANNQRNYFYVYQNKTYDEERAGGFLWSPKYAKGYSHNAGYDTMKQVQPGDVILHSYRGEIVAVSIARSACYSHRRPSGAFSEWSNDGWMIDVTYHILRKSLKVAPYIPKLYSLQPENGPYTAAYRGKQQYLCNANKSIFDFLLEKIVRLQNGNVAVQALLNFLKQDMLTAPKDKKPIKESTLISSIIEPQLLDQVTDNCQVEAFIVEQKKHTNFTINVKQFPMQKVIIGKKVGDAFKLPKIPLTYRIEKISK